MENYLSILEKCALFRGIEAGSLSAMLACLGAKLIEREKGSSIFMEGDPANNVGVLLQGSAQIVKDDFYGRRSIVASIEPGQIFGESFACAGVDFLPVSVVAAARCAVMLIDCRRITQTCSNACSFHSQMILNLLQVVARKNLIFNQKIEITSRRTTREKLMTYLLDQAKQYASDSFTIPFDRQALADYLGVERSALSAEISKLRNEGIIESNRSQFRLLQRDLPGGIG